MDPDATLTQLREHLADSETYPHDLPASWDAVVELFQALDGWMSRGGFAPADWTSR